MKLLILLAGAYWLVLRPPMSYAVKPGVFGTIRDEMRPFMRAVEDTWAEFGLGVPELTSIRDGKHDPKGKHPLDLAQDWSLRNVPKHLRMPVRNSVARKSGSDFDVLYEYPGAPKTASTWPAEVEHLHGEYDPA